MITLLLLVLVFFMGICIGAGFRDLFVEWLREAGFISNNEKSEDTTDE